MVCMLRYLVALIQYYCPFTHEMAINKSYLLEMRQTGFLHQSTASAQAFWNWQFHLFSYRKNKNTLPSLKNYLFYVIFNVILIRIKQKQKSPLPPFKATPLSLTKFENSYFNIYIKYHSLNEVNYKMQMYNNKTSKQFKVFDYLVGCLINIKLSKTF